MENQDKAIPVGHIPSGLFIVCTKDEQNDGFLASWVQQVSFDPLLVTICIRPGRPGYDFIMSGKKFSLNIVADEKTDYLKHFWKGHDPEVDVFQEIPHSVKSGVIAIDEAKSFLALKMLSKITTGDHDLVVCEVCDGEHLNEVFKSKVHLRKTGASY